MNAAAPNLSVLPVRFTRSSEHDTPAEPVVLMRRHIVSVVPGFVSGEGGARVPSGSVISVVDNECFCVEETPAEVAAKLAGIESDELCQRLRATELAAHRAFLAASDALLYGADNALSIVEWARAEQALSLMLIDVMASGAADGPGFQRVFGSIRTAQGKRARVAKRASEKLSA